MRANFSNHILFVTCLSVVSVSAACRKKPEGLAIGGELLSMSTEGEVPLEYSNTEGAWGYLTTGGYVSGSPAIAAAIDTTNNKDAPPVSPSVSPAQPQTWAQLAPGEGSSALVIFGYGRNEAAQLRARIVPCREMRGITGTLAWKPGERCLVPEGLGATQQAALLSCSEGNGAPQSCDSFDELLEMMGGTFFKPEGLQLSASDFGVDTDFDAIGHVRGAKGTFSVRSVAGNARWNDAVISRYRASRGRTMASAGSADLEADVISIKGRGMVGYSLYENGSDPGGGPWSSVNTGEPFPDGVVPGTSVPGRPVSGTYFPNADSFGLNGQSWLAPGISGNVKLYMTGP
jgi:hypothetical protein